MIDVLSRQTRHGTAWHGIVVRTGNPIGWVLLFSFVLFQRKIVDGRHGARMDRVKEVIRPEELFYDTIFGTKERERGKIRK